MVVIWQILVLPDQPLLVLRDLVVTSLVQGTMVDAATDSDLTYNIHHTDTLNVD